jgi:hypothetical protein
MFESGNEGKMSWGGLFLPGGPRQLVNQRMRDEGKQTDMEMINHTVLGRWSNSVLHGFLVPGSDLFQGLTVFLV